ncbi:hypothetical protein NG798_01395 [Ancylothrix sp. C2]|uniref:hypothetical protein n=1 Tax=Ancylothrix sp. D3o TaxID=2953691 RepID=UPI0021BA7D06|nr:hypothetical protein [Ancylothrix sp. D3o]MCT7948434.1 hypothetical protein [Ancylothrix sp. D3o]
MERGLLWLPLLAVFIWLAWAGSNEYQKVEAYRLWAKQFEQAKYDIYAVLGKTGNQLTWGKPTKKGPVNLQSFSLDDVTEIRFLVDGVAVDANTPPTQGKKIELEFSFGKLTPQRIPFTEIPLAAEWAKSLKQG